VSNSERPCLWAAEASGAVDLGFSEGKPEFSVRKSGEGKAGRSPWKMMLLGAASRKNFFWKRVPLYSP